jgi:peptidoglycan/LPS O-acetylase OafA/YrhL
MQSTDRLHGLDAVRALALLLGVALHAAMPYVAGLPPLTPIEAPSNVVAWFWYGIHMLRMPLFFLIAGFFGRTMLERRGLAGFARDRGRRILLPLVAGVPLIILLSGIALVLGTLASGADLQSVQPPKPPPIPGGRSLFASIPLLHLWFLYYLLIFYAGALLMRFAFGGFRNVIDAVIRFLMRGAWGPLLLGLPIAAYYSQLQGWSSWGGLPAPFSLIPDAGALLGYGLFFTFGWLLQRQPSLLQNLERSWPVYCALAIGAVVTCLAIAGFSPHWGPFLKGGELLAYCVSYTTGAWCGTFGLIGLAQRFLSGFSPVRRYLADASYWIYLMHIPALFFCTQVLHPLSLHWSIKYPLAMAGTMLILLPSYHYLVRFTFIGATLNGRRHKRSAAAGVAERIGHAPG